MRRLVRSLAALAFVCSCAPTSREAHADPAKAPVLVELFTSEGCSSCPPADAVLADVSRVEGDRVLTLAFHVDYWDSLGWPDRFASSDFTERQREYAHALGGSGLYTPEMVVNGTEAFTGSDRPRADDAIRRASLRTSEPLAARATLQEPGKLAVAYEIAHVPPGAVINVAVVEVSASTDVRRGENAGRVLRHSHVVRAFKSAPLREAKGGLLLDFPAQLRRDNAEVVAFVDTRGPTGLGKPVVAAARAVWSP